MCCRCVVAYGRPLLWLVRWRYGNAAIIHAGLTRTQQLNHARKLWCRFLTGVGAESNGAHVQLNLEEREERWQGGNRKQLRTLCLKLARLFHEAP
jgi:hypothetical protein